MTSLGMISTIANHLKTNWQPQIQSKRFRFWKEQREKGYIRRHGHRRDRWLIRGLLPRDESFDRIKQMKIFRPRNHWTEKKALFGQNDYIDILGNEKLHPSRILYDVPDWLKSFQGNEYQTILRRRKKFDNTNFKYMFPTKWKRMESRACWLWYHLNYRKKIY